MSHLYFSCTLVVLQDSVDLDAAAAAAAASSAPPPRPCRPPHLHLISLPSPRVDSLISLMMHLLSCHRCRLSWPCLGPRTARAQARIWRGHPAGETLVKYTPRLRRCQTPPTNLSVRDAPWRHNNEHLSPISIL